MEIKGFPASTTRGRQPCSRCRPWVHRNCTPRPSAPENKNARDARSEPLFGLSGRFFFVHAPLRLPRSLRVPPKSDSSLRRKFRAWLVFKKTWMARRKAPGTCLATTRAQYSQRSLSVSAKFALSCSLPPVQFPSWPMQRLRRLDARLLASAGSIPAPPAGHDDNAASGTPQRPLSV